MHDPKDIRFTHYPSCDCTDNIDHPSQAKPGIHVFPDRLWVVAVLFNPLRWRSRYLNYNLFERHVKDSGAILTTVELAYGGRHFEVTEPGNPRHIQLRTQHELWHKENLENIGLHRLPPEAKYIAFIDADVTFSRPDWAQETLHLLQHYDVLQMFSWAVDLNWNEEPMSEPRASFMFRYGNHGIQPHDPRFIERRAVEPWDAQGWNGYGRGAGGVIWHPGLAWAFRRDALDKLGGLLDITITGAGDWHMANALVGNLTKALDRNHTAAYLRQCHEWEGRALKYILHNPTGGVGYMPGMLMHHFHGGKGQRAYEHRHKLVINAKYDPDLDLKRDSQGVWQLTERNVALRDGLRDYARMRDEDGR